MLFILIFLYKSSKAESNLDSKQLNSNSYIAKQIKSPHGSLKYHDYSNFINLQETIKPNFETILGIEL